MATRRKFLVNIIKAALAGTALVIAGNAFAGTPEDKYVKLVDLQLKLIDNWKVLNSSNDTKPDAWKIITPKFDDLLSFMHTNFTAGSEVTDEVRHQVSQLFYNRDYVDSLDEQALRTLIEFVVPVAVMRNLLHRHRIMFNPKETSQWDVFFNRYGQLVISC